MEKPAMILITGAAGFIGSCLLQYLNEQGMENIILVDKFTDAAKEKNWKHKKFKHLVDRELVLDWLHENKPNISFVIHLGARTNIAEPGHTVLEELNTEYSQDIWNYCTAFNIPLIYASSAATYGNGELGYNDDDSLLGDLKPQTEYAISKNAFDKWAIHQLNTPPVWAGLKLFDVYGPNEYHKKHMPSAVLRLWEQAEKTGCVKLFKSNDASLKNGKPARDFIYVKDVVKVINWMYNAMLLGQWNPALNGIYNVGTGKARSFTELATIIFAALQKEPSIIYTALPAGPENNQQEFTEAPMVKLRHAGYNESFVSLEEGVKDYITNYLSKNNYY